MGRFKDLDIDEQEKNKENREYYNRTHYFGCEDTKEFEDILDELEDDDDNDDFLLTEDF